LNHRGSSLTSTRLGHWLLLAIAALHAVASDAAPVPQKREPRLAVIVEGESVSKINPEILQALVEREISASWKGVLLERKEIQTVLDELKLSKQNPGDPQPLQIGKLLNVDYLLHVRVSAKTVRVIVDKFPSGAILHEESIETSLGEEALARQSAVRAIRSIDEDALDASKLYVSIGSIIYDDPFQRYEGFDYSVHDLLRKRLSSDQALVVNERRSVSHLLREFELARSGVSQHVVANLAAPPSDLLILGRFRPAAVQPAGQAKATLEFTVRIVSPTGLAPAREIQFTSLGDDPQRVASAVEKALLSLVKDIKAAGAISRRHQGNLEEYATLKKQAFSLLPSRPNEDGNFFQRQSYRGPSQHSGRPALLRALGSLENAMLFQGDDPQVLLATAAVLEGIVGLQAYSIEKLKPEEQKRIREIMNLALDYIESAYLLSPDYNARGFYHYAISSGFRRVLPARTQHMAKQIVDSAKTGHWHAHEVNEARRYLFDSLESFDEKAQLFVELERQWRQEKQVDLRLIFDMAESIQIHFLKHKDDSRLLTKGAAFAEELIASESPTVQGFGHWIRITIHYCVDNDNVAFVPHLRKLVDLIPAMYREYPDQIRNCSLQFRILDWLRGYDDLAKRKNLPDDVTELYYRYVVNQLSIKNYSAYLMPCLQRLLPALDKSSDFAKGHQIVTEYLEHFTASGSADLERMLLARWRNRFSSELSKGKRLELERLSRVKLAAKDGLFGQTAKSSSAWGGPMRVKKLVYAFDRVWAVQTDPYVQNWVGQAFVFHPGEVEAQQIRTVDGVVTDLAASDTNIAVSTIDNGLWLLDSKAAKTAHYSADNSPLPGNRLCALCARDRDILFALPGKDGLWHMYSLEPGKGEIRDLNLALSYHYYFGIVPGPNPNQAVETQGWENRTWSQGPARLQYTLQYHKDAVKKATVIDAQGKSLLEYTGFELNYVFDFALWRKHLVFATGNGLYTSQPGTNRLRCILNELDLELYSLCPVGDQLFVGTNHGVYGIDATNFDSVIVAGD